MHWIKRLWGPLFGWIYRPPGWTRGQYTDPPGIKDHGLRSNDAPGEYDNTLPKDLEFRGRVILHVEDPVTGAAAQGTQPEGAMSNRLAIYETTEQRFIAEQLRFNGRPMMIFTHLLADNRSPMLSLAQEFADFASAVEWLRAGPLIADGDLARLLEEEVDRHAAGTPCPHWPHRLPTAQ